MTLQLQALHPTFSLYSRGGPISQGQTLSPHTDRPGADSVELRFSARKSQKEGSSSEARNALAQHLLPDVPNPTLEELRTAFVTRLETEQAKTGYLLKLNPADYESNLSRAMRSLNALNRELYNALKGKTEKPATQDWESIEQSVLSILEIPPDKANETLYHHPKYLAHVAALLEVPPEPIAIRNAIRLLPAEELKRRFNLAEQ